MEKTIKNEHQLTPEEKWEQATLANNFLFYKVMHDNPDVCKRVLEILLEMEIDHIEIRQEDEIIVDYESKGIRLDVYGKNENEIFDLEMQATDTKELPERARYYQGVMDVDSLKSGQMYKEMKNSFIVFICLDDIFEKGLPIYTFEHLCRQDTKISLEDRALKYFFIAQNCDKMLKEDQKAFFKLVLANKSSDDFTDRIARLTEDAKKNIQYKRQFMEWERQRTYDFENGKQAGIEQGSHNAKIESAKKMLDGGLSIEQVVNFSGLSIEEVKSLFEKKFALYEETKCSK
ncbi:MAG: Rpn family recombination-promoting nuclease/putative transposase [Treponemataceae bacterium]|nr:Rpn family recombination-promoting nuclease/putative transposase [Treponemataceae bacterium]